MYKKNNITLGIETSCDETGIALYDSSHGLIGHKLYSQIDLHKQYGGVVPEIASRSQIEKIPIILKEVLSNHTITLKDIDTVAVTNRPGLPGSLLVGITTAKTIAWIYNKPLIGVDHLEGHIFSSFLENKVPFPHLCLTASGGHTAIYYVEDFGIYKPIAQTRDDAAGEAFDKVAKLMGLGYPGGPIIEKLAQAVHFEDFFSYPRASIDIIDFSFSGLKTAILYDLIKREAFDPSTKTFLKKEDQLFISQVASSCLVAIGDIFIAKLTMAYRLFPNIKAITFVGGCACNRYLRSRIAALSDTLNLSFYFPSPQFCTDNGAMIALVGSYKAEQGKYASYELDINDTV